MQTENPPWWSDSVVYQVYPRSFADSDGDGIGDIPGITARLDHLAELGVDVVWLSPVYRSPQVDLGYDISDYRDVDPVFGTLADLDGLIAALHARGMRLLMDLVVNHTSDQHPWFVESRSSVDNPKRDFYIWRSGAEPPNNWGSFFGGPTWELDEATGQWYLHLFAREQPDLNWENPQVRTAIYEMMTWWLERGVDGFRMDVVNMLSKAEGLPDGAVRPGARYGDGSPFYQPGPRIHDYLQEMHERVFAGREHAVLTVGEMPGVSVEQARLFTDPARGEVDMVFQFEHMNVDRGATKWDVLALQLPLLKASLGRWQTGLAQTGWNSLYWDNHDQPRVVSRFGDGSPAAAKAWATVLHLHRGTPFVYQGDELGMTNMPFAGIEQYRDVESLNYFREEVSHGRDPGEVLDVLAVCSRDNARTPMQWDDTAHAGFTTGTPWIAVNSNAVDVNAAAQRTDPESVFHHYRRLIALRHNDPVVGDGAFEMLVPDHEQVYAFTRTTGAARLLVVANLSPTPVRLGGLDLPELDGELVLGHQAEPDVLAPWEAPVVRQVSR